MSTRTSSRQAAQKAKEAISSETNGKAAGGAKRKGATDKAPAAKRGKKTDVDLKPQPEPKEEEKAGEEVKPKVAEGEPKKEEQPPPAAEGNITSQRMVH